MTASSRAVRSSSTCTFSGADVLRGSRVGWARRLAHRRGRAQVPLPAARPPLARWRRADARRRLRALPPSRRSPDPDPRLGEAARRQRRDRRDARAAGLARVPALRRRLRGHRAARAGDRLRPPSARRRRRPLRVPCPLPPRQADRAADQADALAAAEARRVALGGTCVGRDRAADRVDPRGPDPAPDRRAAGGRRSTCREAGGRSATFRGRR